MAELSNGHGGALKREWGSSQTGGLYLRENKVCFNKVYWIIESTNFAKDFCYELGGVGCLGFGDWTCFNFQMYLMNAFFKACKSWLAPTRGSGRWTFTWIVKADLHLDGGLEMDFYKACKSRFAPTRGFGDEFLQGLQKKAQAKVKFLKILYSF